MQERRSETSFITQSLVLTQRSFINMYRDVGYYRLRLGIYVGICLFLGLLFRGLDDTYASIQVSEVSIYAKMLANYTRYNNKWLRLYDYGSLPSKSTTINKNTFYFLMNALHYIWQARVLMLVFIAGFLTFMAIGGFPSFVEDMKVC